ERHANHASHRKSTEMNTVDSKMIEDGKHIAGQLIDGIWAGWGGRLAMPAGVVSQDSEIGGQDRHLHIPHGDVCSQGIREQQGRLIFGTRNVVADPSVLEFQKGHGIYRLPFLLAAMARSIN